MKPLSIMSFIIFSTKSGQKNIKIVSNGHKLSHCLMFYKVKIIMTNLHYTKGNKYHEALSKPLRELSTRCNN